MSTPLTVYPTETPGLYRTEDGRPAQHISIVPHHVLWCLHCTRLLDAPSIDHWDIGGHEYCEHCVDVAHHEMV